MFHPSIPVIVFVICSYIQVYIYIFVYFCSLKLFVYIMTQRYLFIWNTVWIKHTPECNLQIHVRALLFVTVALQETCEYKLLSYVFILFLLQKHWFVSNLPSPIPFEGDNIHTQHSARRANFPLDSLLRRTEFPKHRFLLGEGVGVTVWECDWK